MEETGPTATIPPPLPPKTRRAGASTGLGGGASSISGGAVSSISTGGEHVVKIRINPDAGGSPGSIRISVGGQDCEDMVRQPSAFLKQPERASPYFFCNSFPTAAMVISSGQSSPSDTLDSGTCSDLDGSTPPPLPKKSGPASNTVTVTVNGNHTQHRRTGSLTSSGADADSDEDAGSNISCDSLNGHELNGSEEDHFFKTNGVKHCENIMESIQEEKVIPPPSPPLKSVALTVQANNLINKPQPPTVLSAAPKAPPPTPAKPKTSAKTFLPEGLLQDIRDRTATLTVVSPPAAGAPQRKLRTWGSEPAKTPSVPGSPEPKEFPKNASSLFRLMQNGEEQPQPPPKSGGIVQERTYEERSRERNASTPEPVAARARVGSYKYEEDRYYQFHLREHDPEPGVEEARAKASDEEEETFAGLKDLLGNKQASSTIRSAKGTVRGVKNRVRAGIATFLHYPDTKNYKEKEAGKVVLYVTTMGIVRHTFQECLKVKKILRTLLVKYEERDAFMSREVQAELRERMHSDQILVPQLFVEGQHIGDAETIERLNETGELRRMLKPFKSPDVCNTCQVCGGFRLLPCSICNGSKKSMHRNDFTAEFVALKCMSCDEVGLVKCHAC